MFIIFGSRYYGRIDGRGEEHLATKFGHVYFMPIVPAGSRWVERTVGDQLVGFPVRLSWKSVAATYLRMWAPVFAVIAAVTMTIPGFVIAAALAAASAWSWTWRRARGAREDRRTMFHRVAFGTACDPLHRPAAQCDVLRPIVSERFAKVANGRTPEDVARLGADSPLQAALAYGMLRLVASTASGTWGAGTASGARAAGAASRARAASERILSGAKDHNVTDLDAGPYRGQTTEPAVDITTAALASDAAAEVQAREVRLHDAALAARTGPAWDNSPDNPAVQAEIAANKAKRTTRNYVLIGVVAAVFAAFGALGFYRDHQKKQAARRALSELRHFRDAVCACTSADCVAAVHLEHFQSFKRARASAISNSASLSDLNPIIKAANRCTAAHDDEPTAP